MDVGVVFAKSLKFPIEGFFIFENVVYQTASAVFGRGVSIRVILPCGVPDIHSVAIQGLRIVLTFHWESFHHRHSMFRL